MNPRWTYRTDAAWTWRLARPDTEYEPKEESTFNAISGDGTVIGVGRIFQQRHSLVLDEVLHGNTFLSTIYHVDLIYVGSFVMRTQRRSIQFMETVQSNSSLHVSLALDVSGDNVIVSTGNGEETRIHPYINTKMGMSYFNFTTLGMITTLGYTSVSLSSDSSTLALGSAFDNIVYVYKFNVTIGDWAQVANIHPSSQSPSYEMSLSSNGTIISISSPQNQVVSVFSDHIQDGWKQLGSDIRINSNTGRSITLSADGYTIACNGGDSLAAQIYSFDYEKDEWLLFGDASGLELREGWQGHSVSISDDGTLLAAHILSDDPYRNYGSYYQYSDQSWNKVTMDFEMSAEAAARNVLLTSSGFSLLIADSISCYKFSLACEFNQFIGCTGRCAYTLFALVSLFCVAIVFMFIKYRYGNHQSDPSNGVDEENRDNALSSQERTERRKAFVLKHLIIKRIIIEEESKEKNREEKVIRIKDLSDVVIDDSHIELKTKNPRRDVDGFSDESKKDLSETEEESKAATDAVDYVETRDEEGLVPNDHSNSSDDPQTTESVASSPSQKICLICLEPFDVGDEICFSRNEKCPHVFHLLCMSDWLQHHRDCPLCRHDFIPSDRNA